jgi:hypothetical protein
VLADASTEQIISPLASKLSRCKEAMAHFLLSRYNILWVIGVSRYKAYGEHVANQGTGNFIESTGAIRVQLR